MGHFMSSNHNSSRRSFLKKAAVTAYVVPVIVSTQARATYAANGSAQACSDGETRIHTSATYSGGTYSGGSHQEGGSNYTWSRH